MRVSTGGKNGRDRYAAKAGDVLHPSLYLPGLKAGVFTRNTMMNGADFFVSVVDAMVNSLVAMQNNAGLKTIGLSILGSLIAVQVTWILVKAMATGKFLDATLGDLLPLCVASVVAYLFMGNVPGILDVNALITSVTDSILLAVAPSYTSGTSLGQLMLTGLQSMFEIISLIFDLKVGFDVSFADFFKNFFALLLLYLAKFILMIAAIIFLGIAIGGFISGLVFSQIQIVIAFIFMPIFVPFLIFQPMAGFFNTWLTFALTSVFAKIMGVLMLTVAGAIFKAMVELTKKMNNDTGSLAGYMTQVQQNLIVYMSLVLVSALLATLMYKVSAFAGQLIGGMSVGFGGFGDLVRGPVNKSLGGGIGTPEGKGGASGAGSSPNALSGVTQFMPNAVKPITRATGAAASYVAGRMMAKRDADSVMEKSKKSTNKGGGVITRDTSKMSKATGEAYIKHLEGRNTTQAARGEPNYTVQKPTSSTTPINTPSQANSAAATSGTTTPMPTPDNQRELFEKLRQRRDQAKR